MGFMDNLNQFAKKAQDKIQEVTNVVAEQATALTGSGVRPEDWFFTLDGKTRQGPCTTAQLKRLAGAGKLQRSHMVKQESSGKWVQAGSVAILWEDEEPVLLLAADDSPELAVQPAAAAPPPPLAAAPPPLLDPNEMWHYAVNGQQAAPLPFVQLKALIGAGRLAPTDMVWKAGMPAWAAAGTIESLFPKAAVPPPLPPALNPPPLQPPAKQAASDRVTGEITLVGRDGWGRDDLYLFIDEEPLAVANWMEGFHKVPFETTVGDRAIRLRVKESDFSTQIYRIDFRRSGHYSLQFAAGWFLQEFPKSLEHSLAGPALSTVPVPPARKKMITGLWHDVGGSGQTFMFTPDGAMVRDDGFATKFRWLNKETIELYAEGIENTVRYQVLSLSKFELILKTENQSAHFERGQTITEAEMTKRENEARQQRAESAKAFRDRAVGAASVLAAGGFAVLCGGIAIAAAAGGAAGGASGGGGTASTSSSGGESTGYQQKQHPCTACHGKGWHNIGGATGEKRCSICGGQGVVWY